MKHPFLSCISLFGVIDYNNSYVSPTSQSFLSINYFLASSPFVYSHSVLAYYMCHTFIICLIQAPFSACPPHISISIAAH